jgi:hypothetical protein
MLTGTLMMVYNLIKTAKQGFGAVEYDEAQPEECESCGRALASVQNASPFYSPQHLCAY